MNRVRTSISDGDRSRIVEAYLRGETTSSISRVLGIKPTTISTILRVYISENRVEAKKRGRPPVRKLSDIQKDAIRGWVDDNCSLSLSELKARCEAEFNVVVCEKTVGRVLDSFHYTMKRAYTHPVRRNDLEALQIRHEYALNFMHILSSSPHEQIVFFDEVGMSVCMRNKRGRALRGERAVHVVGSIRTRNLSMLCSMNKEGIIHYSVSSRPYTTTLCIESLRFLVDTLREKNMVNVIIVGDNVAFHRSQCVREVIENAGHWLFFLPPYSPFLNPIENMFSKLKGCVKQARPTDEIDLMNKINNATSTITGSDCDGYFRSMLGFLTPCMNRELILD